MKGGRIAIGAAAVAAAFLLSALAGAAVVQQGDLRIGVIAQVQPFKLPRTELAPIAVFVSGHVSNPDGGVPSQLEEMTISVNRHGRLDTAGLPTCTPAEINATSSERAIERCGDALVGSGRFWATIVLPDQRPYPTRGRLLIFNGSQGGKPVIFAHIYTTKPFATSFAIPFAIRRIDRGPYATELSATFPQALGDWGFVDRIKLTLRRKYTRAGKQRSYFNGSCPAPAGTKTVSYPLAHASFSFEGEQRIGLTVPKACRVKGP